MKSTVLALSLLISFSSLFAQKNNLDEIFNKFQGKDGITSVILTSDLIKFVSDIDSKDSGIHFLKNITQVRILSFENAMAQDIVAFDNMVKEIPLNNYKELMVVKENQNNVRMLARESEGRWSDFLLISTGARDHVLINVQGSISPRELQSLSKSVNVTGMACVHKLK